ncbi:MAG: hypothetical protein L0207_04955 [Chlamydiae bacterium]|nr:hypothetical protein [Chlamydiota bacterium]
MFHFPLSHNQELEYIQEFDALKMYDPKKHIVVIDDNNELKVIFKITEERYEKFIGYEGRFQVSERISEIMDLSCETLNSINKATYILFLRAIRDLLENWDPKIEDHLADKTLSYLLENEHLLNLCRVKDFLSKRADDINNNN